jgi:hypothetical protein
VLALAALALVGAVRADTQTYGFELSVSPKLDVCEKVEHVADKPCFLTAALKRWWANGSTEKRRAKLATEDMEAERAALRWVRGKYPNKQYRVRISHRELLPYVGPKAKPRELTLVIEDRASDWLTRTTVVVSPSRKGWVVRKL